MIVASMAMIIIGALRITPIIGIIVVLHPQQEAGLDTMTLMDSFAMVHVTIMAVQISPGVPQTMDLAHAQSS
jgi:hypothetical protein